MRFASSNPHDMSDGDPERLISREEVVATMFNLADIATDVQVIRRLLEQDDEEEEEEEQEGNS
jgi:DNA-binding phage protein